jgi:hypothetical protein
MKIKLIEPSHILAYVLGVLSAIFVYYMLHALN